MVKRAFCVGINNYPYDGSDLKGCVNDARAWAELLTTHFDFLPANVKVITNSKATKRAILAGLKKLLADAKNGDVLVFTNSSHGSYKTDDGGDERKYDQVVCPYDVAKHVILDDELRVLFRAVPPGVHLVAIMDNCFSGTATRAIDIPGPPLEDDRRVRFLNPSWRGDKALPEIYKAKPRGPEKYTEDEMVEVLLSGCNDKEYSFDALIEGAYHGAMTFHAIKAIREANYSITYAQLHEQLAGMIDEAGYPQHPQLEGRQQSKDRLVFT